MNGSWVGLAVTSNIPSDNVITNGPLHMGDFLNTFWLSHPFVYENVAALVWTFNAYNRKEADSQFVTHSLQMCKNCNALRRSVVGICISLFYVLSGCWFQFSTRTILHRINCAFRLHCIYAGHMKRGEKKKDEEIET